MRVIDVDYQCKVSYYLYMYTAEVLTVKHLIAVLDILVSPDEAREEEDDKEEAETGPDVATGCEHERPLSTNRSSVMVCNLAKTERQMVLSGPKMDSPREEKQTPRPRSKNVSGSRLASENQVLMRDASQPL